MSEHREGYLFGRKCEGRASAPDDIRADELKQIAARYGLSPTGTKDVLCNRIREYLLSQNIIPASASDVQKEVSKVAAKKILGKLVLKKKQPAAAKTIPSPVKLPSIRLKKIPSPVGVPLKKSPKVIENIVKRETQQIMDDYRKRINLTPEEIDYFISALELHENTVKLADIVNRYIREHHIVDPDEITRYKYNMFVDELAQKFCRCIDKASEHSPEYSIPICRKGVINNRGLAIHNFRCRNREEEWDPQFLPTKDGDEILGIHPAFTLYNRAENNDTKINNLKKWKALKTVNRDIWYNKL